MNQGEKQRAFVPADLDCSRWEKIQPYFEELERRELDSPHALRGWLADFSRLVAVVDEFGTRRYIEHACHTDDPAVERRFLDFVEQIEPRLKPAIFKMQKRFLECPHRGGLGEPKFALMERHWRADVELYRDENVAIETQVTKLVTEYDKACGQMQVEFRGKTQTLQQLARYLEEPQRATRQEAWELGEGRRAQDQETFDRLFDELLALRGRMAANAGMSDYREYTWRRNKRFDYTPEDCLRFAEAVRETCLPVVEELAKQRKAELGVDFLRPWDTAVDPKGRSALRPFPAEDPARLVEGTQNILRRVAADLAENFRGLRDAGTLDLESRKGKRPGGFQATLEVARQPFIFMNAAGLQRDVETLLHEFGHALHTIESRGEPLMFLAHSPMEFAEVASMSMELLGGEHLEEFYSAAEAQRARRTHLEGIIRLMPWIATVDSFQHWLYTHPGHTRDERAEAWLATWGGLSSRQIDWSGHEDVKRFYWQRQLHLYHSPFYYIEYGIAQLGALGVWLNHRRQGAEAIAAYRAALALGGTQPLPKLFEAAGLKFDFSAKTLGPLMRAVGEELARLPS